MAPANLQEWLAYLERLHPAAIELGLERVGRVWARLAPATLPFLTITVGGTNGKGSVVCLLESILRAAGYRVGAYTSPHLLRYNERVRIDGREAEDSTLCDSFARVEAARGETSLTSFEFGTLAALDQFVRSGVEVAILEVGLGGRLDAVNLIDAEAAVIASIDIDHVDWLGDNREVIGWEKAGILRAGKPVVCGDPDPPASLLERAQVLGSPFKGVGEAYRWAEHGAAWDLEGEGLHLRNLPRPRLALQNAATALMTLACLREQLPVTEAAVRAGLQEARLPGRFQILPEAVLWILDVAHNPHAAALLARRLNEQPVTGRTRAVVAMLADKDIPGTMRPLLPLVAEWYAAALPVPRGATAERVAESLPEGSRCFPSVAEALATAVAEARPGDRLLVFGSFHTVAQALAGRI